jgi:hypothetical protein
MKPIIYLYFHSRILTWKGKEMTEKEFKSSLFQWRIPKTLRYLIMKEMEKIGLLKVEKGKVYMNNYYFDEDKIKKDINFKDIDTKLKNPYLSIDLL